MVSVASLQLRSHQSTEDGLTWQSNHHAGIGGFSPLMAIVGTDGRARKWRAGWWTSMRGGTLFFSNQQLNKCCISIAVEQHVYQVP